MAADSMMVVGVEGLPIKLAWRNAPPLAEWAEREIMFPDDEVFRHFDMKVSPWAAAVFRWFEDARVERIYLIQGSSLCSVISLAELTLTARRILTITYASMESYITLTFFYFVVCAVLSLCTKLIERRLVAE